MLDFVAYDIALVPLIVGLVRIFTGIGLPKCWAPLLALAFGIIAGVVYMAPDNWPKRGTRWYYDGFSRFRFV